MAKSVKAVKSVKKIKTEGEKRAGVMVWISVVALCLILAASGKLLYDETLKSAATENFAMNRQASAALDIFFSNIYYSSSALLETVSGANNMRPGSFRGDGNAADSSADDAPYPAALFFENNPYAAAVALYENSRYTKDASISLINSSFFRTNDASPRLIDIFTELHIDALNAAQNGIRTVLNGESIFKFPVLAMFFPYRGRAAVVFFSTAELEDLFKTGAETTYCTGMNGTVLLYSERAPRNERVASLSKSYVFKSMLTSEQKSGWLTYTSGNGRRMFGAYTKLTSVPLALITETSYGAILSGLILAAERAAVISVIVILFLALILTSLTKSINASLKKLNLFDDLERKLKTVSRFANMQLARQSLEGVLPDEAEYKKATVLLSGIEAFNENVERLNPKEAFALLNDYTGRLNTCVKKTNGSFEQLPDGIVMGHWGSLWTSGNAGHDALNAIRCALMMRVSIYELNAELAAAGKPVLKFSCGISSGEFIAGTTNWDENSRHILIGENIIIADIARAQTSIFDTDILISESAWRLTQKYILVQEMPPLQIEGKLRPLRIFALINLRTRKGEAQVFPTTLDDVRSLFSPSVQPHEV
ncbi:MAG: hypothetical protein LBC27_04330 [Spirochaetaceae bacterium]|jgi:adenylate cyclase|nr:hypothetical protein [Spirochaetaceae bacterium]